MRKTIIFVLLFAFIISFAPFARAEKNEKENVIYIDHSQDHLLKTDYTRAEIEADVAHRQKIEEKKLKKERQLAALKEIYPNNGADEIKAVGLSANSSSFYSKSDWFGYYRLYGEVTNTGTSSCIYPYIVIKLKDSGGNVLDTIRTMIDGGTNVVTSGYFTNALYPGDTGYFESTSYVPYEQVAGYTWTFDYETYSHSRTKTILEFDGTPHVGSSYSGDVKITGWIKNTSPYYLTYYTDVFFAIYNSSGQVIDLKSARVSGSSYTIPEGSSGGTAVPAYTTDSAIEPGASAQFTYYCDAPRGQYASYKYNFEFEEVQVIVPPKYNLAIQSTPVTDAYIAVSPSDYYGSKSGNTNFTRTYEGGTIVTLTASLTLNSGAFLNWTVDGTVYTDQSITVTMDSAHTAVANYAAPSLYILSVKSFPSTGVDISVNVTDQNGDKNGTTNFKRTYTGADVVTVTAPSTANGLPFSKWVADDSSEYSTRALKIYMTANFTIRAVYKDPARSYTVEVKSSGASNVDIEVDTTDINSEKNGTTTFTRAYSPYEFVSFTAPETAGGKYFSHWTADGTDWPHQVLTLLVDTDETAVATYIDNPPVIVLNRTDLYFTYVLGGNMPAPQSLIVSNSGGGNMVWAIDENYDAISCNPASATGDAIVTISMDPAGYAVGSYSGILYVEAGAAGNSPQAITVYLTVIEGSENTAPIGDFATPADGAVVSSSVAVTGWVVDDTGVASVGIYYKEGGALKFIGDAVFVDGARSDITDQYPTYPGSYKAGWGYMLLTNFLPNGDATYELHAVATDSEGKQTDLGSKTITVDNAGAVKPFGAIDTPAQGGTASGGSFAQVGWVLTPMPNTVPTDGSTIDVYVNGVNIGHPTYNIYREDIATYFPGYNNSAGSLAKYVLDTTAYATGHHSIFWIATDNAGNADGIGSRFFTVENAVAARTAPPQRDQNESLTPVPGTPSSFARGFGAVTDTLPMDFVTPVRYKKGTDNAPSQTALPGGTGISHIRMLENERIVIDLSTLVLPGSQIIGYTVTGSGLSQLPPGSTLDSKTATFYWAPVLGYMGDYTLTFIVETEKGKMRKDIRVTINPKTNNN